MSLESQGSEHHEADRDHYTGHLTTGHDWNGIKELNTRVPKLLIVCLSLAFLFALGYWYLMPAWPLGNDYTRGKLGLDQKAEINEQLKEAAAANSEWTELMVASEFDTIKADQNLMKIVQESGPALFADNCAMCHGQQAKGNLYFPNLTDASWLWGGSPEQIHKTLTVGINSDAEGTRIAQMPAFGTTGILDSSAIDDVVKYLLSLSGGQVGDGSRADEMLSVNRGKAVFTVNCVACHGADGQGNTLLGAPNLADNYWIYGGDVESITHTLNQGQAGLMPAWNDRLESVEIKILSLYVAGLSQEQDGSGNDAASE